jgi:hypothetical protein
MDTDGHGFRSMIEHGELELDVDDAFEAGEWTNFRTTDAIEFGHDLNPCPFVSIRG